MDTQLEITPRLQAFVKGQGEMLRMITGGASLDAILDKLVRWVEAQAGDGLIASVLIVDASGQRLHLGAGPSLPDAYNAEIDGIRIGPKVGSCGTAAFLKKPVIVDNIATDPLWEDFRELALAHRLRACWSTPLISNNGVVRGTFAVYYRSPRKPSQDDLDLIALVSQLALMAIEFQIAEEERRKRRAQEKLDYQRVQESESNFRNLVMKAPVGICILDPSSLVVQIVNDAFLELVGQNRAEFENRPYWETLKEAEPEYGPVMRRVIETGVSHVGREAEVILVRNGRPETVYVSFVYDPVKEPDGHVGRLMVLGIEVTDQVRARKEIEQSEQQVRSLVESAPFPIGVYAGKEMRIQFANQSIIDVWGKGPDVIGKRYPEILPELENQQIFQQLDHVFETGESFHAKNQQVDLVVEGRAQSYFFNYSFTPVRNGKGEVFAVMNTAADVTDLNLANRRIEESERNLRNIITQAPVAMCILRGPTYVVEIANERMFRLWGRPAHELLGKPVFEGLPEAADQGFEALLRHVYETGETYRAFGVPATFPREDGLRTVYIDFVYEAFRDGDGAIVGVMGVATDVTEQVEAARKLAEAEERARLAVESAELGTYEVNLLSNESVISPRLSAIFNLDAGAPREAFVNAILPEDRSIRDMAYKVALETGLLQYDARVLWKDGAIHWVRVKGRVFRNNGGEPVRLLGVVQDITEQKTFADALARQVRERTSELESKNQELERSNANLEEFAHAASHDLKEPIRKVLFFTDQLKSQLEARVSQTERRLLERIETAGTRMRALIDDLLQYSHASQTSIQKEDVDLAAKVGKVLEDLEVEIAQKRAVINVGSLPHVRGYRRQLQQLFQNLISNALKYHRPGEPPVISISSRTVNGTEIPLPLTGLERTAQYRLIEVSDQGIGFAQEQADKIFQMFQRLHAKNEYSGTGVGLSIAKKVAENHGGKIYARSEPGKGATFAVYLPATEPG